jgi:two-component sensor histidine kinase
MAHEPSHLLAIIRRLAGHTGRVSTSVDDFIASFDGRLAALARTQLAISRSDRACVDLEEMVREELLSHGLHDGVSAGPPICLTAQPARALALALHEFVCEAIECGARHVRIGWRLSPDGEALEIDLRRQGCSQPATSIRDLLYGAPATVLDVKIESVEEEYGRRCRLLIPIGDDIYPAPHDNVR